MANNMTYPSGQAAWGSPAQPAWPAPMPAAPAHSGYTPPYPPAQPSYEPPPVNPSPFVDGEFEARARSIPQGWPPDTPYVMWDVNRNYQYVKSVDPTGRPYPMRVIEFFDRTPQPQQSSLPAMDPSNFVTKEDMEQMEQRILRAMNQGQQPAQNQNGTNQGGNRGARNG